MIIDNFDIIRKHLDFVDTKLDRYVVHILRRPKDIPLSMKNALGANESQRLIKTYYIDSLEYFDKKREAIKELCRANNARAYIIVQPKDNFECLLNLGENIFKAIRNKNYSVKPEHLVRQAFCEWHKTRKKQWILDLDLGTDAMVETWVEHNFGGNVLCKREWTLEKVQELVKKHLKLVGKNEDEMYTVKTPHGAHIITSPFNLQAAYKECSLLYEGVQTRTVSLDKYVLNHGDKGYTGSIDLDTKYKTEQKDVVGWLHKDGMTILWCEVKDEQ